MYPAGLVHIIILIIKYRPIVCSIRGASCRITLWIPPQPTGIHGRKYDCDLPPRPDQLSEYFTIIYDHGAERIDFHCSFSVVFISLGRIHCVFLGLDGIPGLLLFYSDEMLSHSSFESTITFSCYESPSYRCTL